MLAKMTARQAAAAASGHGGRSGAAQIDKTSGSEAHHAPANSRNSHNIRIVAMRCLQSMSLSQVQRPARAARAKSSSAVRIQRTAATFAAEKVGKAAVGRSKKSDFVHLDDFSKEELLTILDRAKDVKQRVKTDVEYQPLRGKSMSMIFAKPSLRTRVSFESVRARAGLPPSRDLSSETSQLDNKIYPSFVPPPAYSATARGTAAHAIQLDVRRSVPSETYGVSRDSQYHLR